MRYWRHIRLANYFLVLLMLSGVSMIACSSNSKSSLASISVTPTGLSLLGVGTTQQLTATGAYSDGSKTNISSRVKWASDNTGTATVSATGLVTTVGNGTADIIASMDSTASPPVVLTVKTLNSITIKPLTPPNLVVGSSQNFTAYAIYSDGSSEDISTQVTWTSSNGEVATINSNGLATGSAAGTTKITANKSGITSPPITLSVISLASIVVTPSSPSNLGIGANQQFEAMATYSDGSSSDITSKVTWKSSNPEIANISLNGLVTGSAAGTTKITAFTDGTTSSSVSLKVIALSSIAVVPNSPANIKVGLTQQFTATGTYSDGSMSDITTQVVWTSSNTSTATISATGLVTGLGGGTTNITATQSGITSSSVSLKVISLSSIGVTPATPASLPINATLQFTATGTYSDSSTADISSLVNWTSSNNGIVTISSTGLARRVAGGTAKIVASLSGINSTAITLTIPIITTYGVGTQPVAVCSDGTNIWVSNSGSNNVTKIRISDDSVLGTYNVVSTASYPIGPQGICFDGKNIWVANDSSSNVNKINISDGTILGTYNVSPSTNPAGPMGICFDGTNIWLDNYGNQTITKMRASDGSIVGVYTMASYSFGGICFDGSDIWVANTGSGSVSKLSTTDGTILGTYAVGLRPSGICFDGTNIWVTNAGDNTVSKIRPSDGAILGTYAVGTDPLGICFDGSNIWVTNTLSNNVIELAVNDGTVLGTYVVGTDPRGICFDGSNIWVANMGSGSVSKLTTK